MPTQTEINRLAKRIATLESRRTQEQANTKPLPEWMDDEAAITAAEIMRDMGSRLAAHYGLPEGWAFDDSISRERFHDPAMAVWELFLTWDEAESAEAAFAASERIVTRWPPVEGSRELMVKLWPHLDPDAPFVLPMHRWPKTVKPAAIENG